MVLPVLGRIALVVLLVMAMAPSAYADTKVGFYWCANAYHYPMGIVPCLEMLKADGFGTMIVRTMTIPFGQGEAYVGLASEIDTLVRIGLAQPGQPVLAVGVETGDVPRAAQYATRKWPELVLGNVDEPTPPKIDAVVAQANMIRGAGHRTGTAIAGYDLTIPHKLAGTDKEGILADYLDVWVVHGTSWDSSLRKLAKEKGAELWAYYCIPMRDRPQVARYYTGLWCWAHQPSTALIWALTHSELTRVTPRGKVEFEKEDHWSLVVPKPWGPPMKTAGYNGLVQGIKDYKLLTSMERSTDKETLKWLADLRARIPDRMPNAEQEPFVDPAKTMRRAAELAKKGAGGDGS